MWDDYKRYNIHTKGIPDRKEREKGPEEIFEIIMTKTFLNVRHQTTDPGSSENTKCDKCQKDYM